MNSLLLTRHRNSSQQKKFEGFDFLRTIFSIAIVAYKTKIFDIAAILGLSNLAYILSGMLGAMAVPVFLQMSLFLFYYKNEKTGLSYFIKKRLPRLISLYLFWVGLITLFDIFFVGNFESIKIATSSPKSLVEFIVSGNNTPYFFFFSLIFVTIFAEILVLVTSRIKKTSIKIRMSYFLLFTSSILIFVCSLIDPIINNTGVQISWLNFLNNITRWDYTPFNFLPYVFTTAITAQEYREGKLEGITKWLKLKLYFLLFLASAFFILEWTLTSKGLLIQVDQGFLDHYMRLSLVFGSWLLLYLALLSKRKVPAIIQFISQCSLGIYGFHVFFTFKKPLPLGSIPFLGSIFQAVPVLEIIAAFVVTLLGSIGLTLLFRKIKWLRRFVSV